jgi:hypothetical protein
MNTPTRDVAGTRVPLDMDPRLRDLVTIAAQREGLTRNAWIRTAILRHLPPELLTVWEGGIPAP